MQLRHLMFKKSLLLALSISFIITGCDKDDDAPAAGNKITDLVVADASLSTLEAAVVRANLAATLSGTGPFTVFAPDDAAFSASGITPAVINTLTQAQLQTILLYHTLGSKVAAADIPAARNSKVVTAGGDSVFVTKNSSGVYVNGIQVAQADINASNGIIHKIGRVLNPPTGNIVQTAVTSGLDSLVKAVTRATTVAGGDPSLAGTLSTATLTVFAPTNAAFTNLLSALSLTNINDIPIGTLLAVLRYHVVAGRTFSSDLANGALTMLAGGNATINLTNGTSGGPTITGTNNGGTRSNITAANIVCRNGVVHLIDRVLIP